MDVKKLVNALWLLLIIVATIVYVSFGILRLFLVISIVLGIFLWWLVGFLASSERMLKAWFNLLRIIVPRSREHLEADSGTFLAEGEIPEKIGWKKALLEEGVEKSFLPVLLMFGILQYILKVLKIETMDQLFNVSLLAFVSPLYVCPIAFLWILLDSKWIEYDKRTNKVMRVGEHVLLYLRSIAGLSALIGLVSVLTTSFGAGVALLFPLATLAIASAPIYLTTVIYVKFFHYKFVKKVHNYLLFEKKLPVATVQIVPVSTTITSTPTTPYIEIQEEVKEEKLTTTTCNFCPYCGTQIPSNVKFCPKCGSSLKVE